MELTPRLASVFSATVGFFTGLAGGLAQIFRTLIQLAGEIAELIWFLGATFRPVAITILIAIVLALWAYVAYTVFTWLF